VSLILHEQTRRLVKRLEGQLPHALVIDGPSGSGVRTAAEHLARSMNSLTLTVEAKKSQNGTYIVDLDEENIIIDDIRLLYEQTRSKQPGNHVYILDTGERTMTNAAQNAFLKLLEEPRDGLFFIIVTHHYDQLLSTITSRSQRLTLLPVSEAQTRELISSLAVHDPVQQARLSFVGQGLPALVKRLIDDTSLYEARVAIMSDAKTMIGGQAYEKAVVAHKYKDKRADTLTLIDDMNHQISVILKKNPDQTLVALIDRLLIARDAISNGGNVRLQLLNSVV
jgi:replication-associated recombination protein RarA